MKNNFKKIILICILFFNNNAHSESFIFDTKKIEILENGNQINAYKGKAISKEKGFELVSAPISFPFK